MTGRSTTASFIAPVLPARAPPDLDVPADLALSFVVTSRGGDHTLGWLARNRPLQLEELMDKVEPGTVLFGAVCTAYNYWETRIRPAVENRNRRVGVLTRAAAEIPRRRLTRQGVRHLQAV